LKSILLTSLILLVVGCSKARVLKISKGFRGLYCKGEERVRGKGMTPFDLVISEEKLLESVIIEKKASKYKFWFEIQSTPESTEYLDSGRNTIIWKYTYKTVISDIESSEVVKHESGGGLTKEEGTWHDALGEKLYPIDGGDEISIHCYRY